MTKPSENNAGDLSNSMPIRIDYLEWKTLIAPALATISFIAIDVHYANLIPELIKDGRHHSIKSWVLSEPFYPILISVIGIVFTIAHYSRFVIISRDELIYGYMLGILRKSCPLTAIADITSLERQRNPFVFGSVDVTDTVVTLSDGSKLRLSSDMKNISSANSLFEDLGWKI